jgi:hypothetical protein
LKRRLSWTTAQRHFCEVIDRMAFKQ